MLQEQGGGLLGLIHNQAQHAIVGCLGNGDGTHINGIVRQHLGDLGELPGAVFEEYGDLMNSHDVVSFQILRLSMTRTALPSLRAMDLGATSLTLA